ncbi:hypothetical protein BGX33_010271, partial [Mortierella sp. NVP41]
MNLVCDGIVVDNINCPIRPTGPASPPSWHAMNNGASIVNIDMQHLCSKDLFPSFTASKDTGENPFVIESFDEDDDSAEEGDTDGQDVAFVSEKNDKHAAYHKYHRNRGHPKRGYQSLNTMHFYQDRCVADGDICGNRLYGCDFISTTLYRCGAIGEPPKPIDPNSNT